MNQNNKKRFHINGKKKPSCLITLKLIDPILIWLFKKYHLLNANSTLNVSLTNYWQEINNNKKKGVEVSSSKCLVCSSFMVNKQYYSVDSIQANKAVQLRLTSNFPSILSQDIHTHTQREGWGRDRDRAKVRVSECKESMKKFQTLEYNTLRVAIRFSMQDRC